MPLLSEISPTSSRLRRSVELGRSGSNETSVNFKDLVSIPQIKHYSSAMAVLSQPGILGSIHKRAVVTTQSLGHDEDVVRDDGRSEVPES